MRVRGKTVDKRQAAISPSKHNTHTRFVIDNWKNKQQVNWLNGSDEISMWVTAGRPDDKQWLFFPSGKLNRICSQNSCSWKTRRRQVLFWELSFFCASEKRYLNTYTTSDSRKNILIWQTGGDQETPVQQSVCAHMQTQKDKGKVISSSSRSFPSHSDSSITVTSFLSFPCLFSTSYPSSFTVMVRAGRWSSEMPEFEREGKKEGEPSHIHTPDTGVIDWKWEARGMHSKRWQEREELGNEKNKRMRIFA